MCLYYTLLSSPNWDYTLWGGGVQEEELLSYHIASLFFSLSSLKTVVVMARQ
jgi:hypothetical protein